MRKEVHNYLHIKEPCHIITFGDVIRDRTNSKHKETWGQAPLELFNRIAEETPPAGTIGTLLMRHIDMPDFFKGKPKFNENMHFAAISRRVLEIKKGYGTELLKHAEEVAKEHGIDYIFAWTGFENKGAIRTYEKANWIRVEIDKTSIYNRYCVYAKKIA